MIDLSHKFKNGMQTYNSPWHTKYQMLNLGKIGKIGRETKKIILGSHCGTHIDAPRHFIKKGKTVENIITRYLYGDAELIKFVNKKDNYKIELKELKEKIKFPKLKKIIFQFGWDKYYGKPKFYKDHPYFSIAVCKWLVKKKYHLIGMDSPQIEDSRIKIGSMQDGQNHKILLGSNIILLEYLTNLSKIKKNKFKIIVAPLNLAGSDGAPARCFCL
mgnify:FL=1